MERVQREGKMAEDQTHQNTKRNLQNRGEGGGLKKEGEECDSADGWRSFREEELVNRSDVTEKSN